MSQELKFVSVIVFLIGTVSFAQQAGQALTAGAGKTKPAAPFEAVIRCSYTPQADTKSSSLPTYPLGLSFSMEKNNNNEIAADIFKLNDKSQPIRQIGHAELNSEASDLAADSDYDFGIVWPTAFASIEDGAKFTATLEVATTFANEFFYDVPLTCQKAPKKATESQTTKAQTASQL